MATRGNRTCVELQNVSKTGFLNNSDSLIIKGIWFPQHFSLAVTDGVGAWKAEVSENLATRIAGDLHITTTQFIDKAQLHLGEQKANSLYSLHYVSSDEVQLLCNSKEDDLDLNMKFAIDLVLVTASVVEITFDMVKFLLDAYFGLKEDSEKHARARVREQAVIENAMTSLKSELQMMKSSGFKACEETLALVSVPCTAGGWKRKNFDGLEDVVSGKKSSHKQHQQQQQQQAASNSKLRRSTSGTRDPARLGLSPVPLAVGIEEGNGASRVGVSAEEQEITDEGSNEDRSNEKLLAMFNIDGSLEHLVPNEKKKRGRPRKSLVPAEVTTNTSQLLPVEVSGAAHNPGGLIELTSEGDRAAEHRIAEHAAKAIKLLEPFANPMSTKLLLKDRPEREIPPSPERSAELALAVPVNEGMLPEPIKEFEVINADFHNFDNGRTKQEMAMGQHWALYDDQDGMPRFYGRICNFIPEPFEAEVEWFEPHRPAHRPSGLMKSLGLSAACGEFKLGSVSDQPLAAFSHRIEILDARKGIYKFYPCKGDVWALYKDWDDTNINFKQLKKNTGEVRLCYDLVEVRVEFVKEKGVKVVPLVKVPNFRTMFQAGNPMMAYWILPKDMRDRFSHQIATHRFDGNEIDFGVPRGAFELDSASTPDEYMLSPAENKIDIPVLATL